MVGEYNGWSSYITWRIWNDVLSKIDFTEPVDEDQLMEIANDVVTSNFEMKNGSHLMEDYAITFIALVDYSEIAEAINEDIKFIKQI